MEESPMTDAEAEMAAVLTRLEASIHIVQEEAAGLIKDAHSCELDFIHCLTRLLDIKVGR